MSRRDVKELRAKLLDRGVALLMEQGYHGTGLQGLVQSVGVPKGSFYNYFESKEAFSAEVVKHYVEPFIQRLEAHLRRPDVKAEVALKGYFDELIEETQRHDFKGGCLLGDLIGEIGDTSELCRRRCVKRCIAIATSWARESHGPSARAVSARIWRRKRWPTFSSTSGRARCCG